MKVLPTSSVCSLSAVPRENHWEVNGWDTGFRFVFFVAKIKYYSTAFKDRNLIPYFIFLISLIIAMERMINVTSVMFEPAARGFQRNSVCDH